MLLKFQFSNNIYTLFQGFETVLIEDEQDQVLVKNRHKKLKADENMTLKMTVKYKNDKAPSIIEYRLNARKLCPDQKM